MHARPTTLTRTGRTLGKTLGALSLSAALAVTAACGSSSQSDGESSPGSGFSSSAAEHNDADVAFASDMLAHHAQAIEMVDMTEGRPLDPQVAKLADQIKAAQAPEIDTFTTWLKQWGEKVPDTGGHDMSDMGSGDGAGMNGMMSESDMTGLANAPDSEFQDMWLKMMIEHHEGAVEMARTETTDGKYKPATKLAGEIATSQATEIDTMKQLLS